MNAHETSTTRLFFSANRKLTLLTLVALPILISLGFWQLGRAAEKDALETAWNEQQQLPPIELTDTDATSLPDYRRVLVTGEFDTEHTWLLDNKQRRGQAGYEVVSPFRLHDGRVFLVNRGWLPGSGKREQLPQVPRVSGPVMLSGELLSISEHPLLDAASENPHWPRVILALDPAQQSVDLGVALQDRYLRLDEASPGALITDWQARRITATKHRGYAVQWFAMALALCIWFVVANTNLLHTWRRRTQE